MPDFARRHATVEYSNGRFDLVVFGTNDPGPVIEWVEIDRIELDDMHVIELLGTASIALGQHRQLQTKDPADAGRRGQVERLGRVSRFKARGRPPRADR